MEVNNFNRRWCEPRCVRLVSSAIPSFSFCPWSFCHIVLFFFLAKGVIHQDGGVDLSITPSHSKDPSCLLSVKSR